jgi:branched-chain amino acid transport system permease protein
VTEVSEFLLFVFLGLGLGALIAGLSLGIVLSYQGSGTINLALGGIAMLGGYVFYDLRTGGRLLLPPLPGLPHTIDVGGPWGIAPAFAVAVLTCSLTGALFDVVVLRRLRGASGLAKLLASLGLLLTLQAIIVLRFGTAGQAEPPVFSEGANSSVRLFGQLVPDDRFILTGITVLLAVFLSAVYRFTRFGIATRAAAEDETKAVMFGLSANALSLSNNVVAFALAGALGILVAPMSQLDPTTIALCVVPALAAALFARFTSFGIATVAGLLMGVVSSLVTYFSSKSWFPTSGGLPMPGVTELLFFLAVLLAMYVRGTAFPVRGTLAEIPLPSAPRARWLVRPAVFVSVLGTVALLTFPFDFRQALINSMIGTVVCLSFVVSVGFVGQMSILQLPLAGIAGFVVSKLAVHASIGFPFGALLAVAAAAVVGTGVGFSTLRVRGVHLAIVTLAGAFALEQFVFANPSIGGGASGAPVPAPRLFGLGFGPNSGFPVNAASPPSPLFGLVCLAAAIALGLLVASLRRSRLGPRMLAVRANERAAAAAGIDVRSIKLLALALASAIAGTAGVLYAYDFGTVTADSYSVLAAMGFVAFAYLGGITTVAGAVVGGLLVTQGLGIQVLNSAFGVPSSYQLLVGGVALVVSIMFNPLGIAGRSI